VNHSSPQGRDKQRGKTKRQGKGPVSSFVKSNGGSGIRKPGIWVKVRDNSATKGEDVAEKEEVKFRGRTEHADPSKDEHPGPVGRERKVGKNKKGKKKEKCGRLFRGGRIPLRKKRRQWFEVPQGLGGKEKERQNPPQKKKFGHCGQQEGMRAREGITDPGGGGGGGQLPTKTGGPKTKRGVFWRT